MSELKHWLDESSDADDFERAILRSGSLADPSQSKRDEVWANVVGTLALAPAAVAESATKVGMSGVKSSAVWLGVGKGFVVGLAIYGAVSGVTEIAERLSAQPAPASAKRVTRVPSDARGAPGIAAQLTPPVAPAAALERQPEPALGTANPGPSLTPSNAIHGAAAAQPSTPAQSAALASVAAFEPTPAPAAASAGRTSQLKAEAAALSSAREALRAGRLSDAFAQLEASRRQFSAPELYQEREALMIELLSRSGQVEAARQRANAFLARFPESPHADQVRNFATR